MINYKDFDYTIRRGIKTIVESLGNPDDPLDFDIDKFDKGLIYLLNDISGDDLDDNITSFNNFYYDYMVNNVYPIRKARIISDKIEALTYMDDFDIKQTRKILREFDNISYIMTDFDMYPLPLVKSIYYLNDLKSNENIGEELYMDIIYILSHYVFDITKVAYIDFLKNQGYDYNESGFMSPEERDAYASKKNIYLPDYYDDVDLDPEIYGCSVKVKFPNNRTYRYNCKDPDIRIHNEVYVTGKMKNIKGVVVDYNDLWNTAEYMEEVSDIIGD